jgi:hypothetical protein
MDSRNDMEIAESYINDLGRAGRDGFRFKANSQQGGRTIAAEGDSR